VGNKECGGVEALLGYVERTALPITFSYSTV
jgi:hypothetical protein